VLAAIVLRINKKISKILCIDTRPDYNKFEYLSDNATCSLQ
jgi:hypothetical protein